MFCGGLWGVVVFQGESDHSIDDKGRVIIPTRFRSHLGDRFYITRGFNHCLWIYTEADYKSQSDALSKQRQLDENVIRLQRFFTATESSIDTQGRVAIPSKLREWAYISESTDVVLVGTGSKIEVWDKATWDNYSTDISDDMISSAAQDLGIL
jgi:MraZ protein